MRILAVSDYIVPELTDTSGGGRLPDVDMVLSCGDLPPEYLTSLAQACDAPLYYVRGNHDIRPGPSPCGRCIDIHGQVVACKGLTILGLEGSHWYNGGPVQYTEAEMRILVRHVRARFRRFARLDIVVTHAAPWGIGDGSDLCHRGFRSFRRLIDRMRPRFFLHGHIHRPLTVPADRVTVLGRTQVINCAGYHVLEVDDATAPG